MAKSVMDHQFSQVPSVEIQRSSFDRSHGLKTTFDGGQLVPIYADEVLPGDTFNMKMTAFGRMATPIHPIMDNLHLETFFFFVPNRLLWDNWQKFNGEQDNPGDSTDFTIPRLASGLISSNSIGDYLGLPVGLSLNPAALHHRAYNKIWNSWFRDENLQPSVPERTGAGPDATADYKILRRGKRHDYFTSALPWPQKGPTVNLPLGNSAPVTGIGLATTSGPSQTNINVIETGGVAANYPFASSNTGASDIYYLKGTGSGVSDPPDINADLTNATAATINELREAFQIQRMHERDARGGTRYTEIVRAHFGVVSPDARLQRPEFLGGGSSFININPVAQTSETATGSQTPQGNLSAYGTVTARNHGFTKSFTEHGVLIGLVNVRADLTYNQGINRMFNRNTRFDYFWPALSNLGEQTVLNAEIYTQGLAADAQVFGYQERYAEYRYKPSQLTGKFRTSISGTLSAWHLGQNFTSLPLLNEDFIQDFPPIDRVVAVQDEPEFLLDAYFNLRCARPMPLYGVPGMIDHF